MSELHAVAPEAQRLRVEQHVGWGWTLLGTGVSASAAASLLQRTGGAPSADRGPMPDNSAALGMFAIGIAIVVASLLLRARSVRRRMTLVRTESGIAAYRFGALLAEMPATAVAPDCYRVSETIFYALFGAAALVGTAFSRNKDAAPLIMFLTLGVLLLNTAIGRLMLTRVRVVRGEGRVSFPKAPLAAVAGDLQRWA